jgi:hypothetical protein
MTNVPAEGWGERAFWWQISREATKEGARRNHPHIIIHQQRIDPSRCLVLARGSYFRNDKCVFHYFASQNQQQKPEAGLCFFTRYSLM